MTSFLADKVRNGLAPHRLKVREEPGTTMALLDESGDLLALAEALPEGAVKLLKVFA